MHLLRTLVVIFGGKQKKRSSRQDGESAPIVSNPKEIVSITQNINFLKPLDRVQENPNSPFVPPLKKDLLLLKDSHKYLKEKHSNNLCKGESNALQNC
jgi:hypothetical protein